jgi:AcrR family transcriptional regulator
MILPLQELADPAETSAAPRVHPSAAVDIGRRDRKKNATRQALRSAALRLVAERGFTHVTVEDIAEAADVSTRTFFNYFPTKESAVIGGDPERIEQMRMTLLQRPVEESALEALSAVLVQYAAAMEEELDDLGEGREAWFRRFSVVRQDPDLLGAYVAHISEVERILVTTLAERLGTTPDRDPIPALVAATALAASRVAALFWSENRGAHSLAELTALALNCVAGGLTDEKAFAATTRPTSSS